MCSASCCLGDGREILLLLDEEPLCRRVTRESEVLPLHLAESASMVMRRFALNASRTS
jgi:hypothetical protein